MLTIAAEPDDGPGVRPVWPPRAELARLFAGLDEVGPLLLAVSGGPDSMALMRLIVRWGGDLPAVPPIHVACVDHGLRSEAVEEARHVASVAADFGLPCTILRWEGPKPVTRIQERARAARYALLGDHAREIGSACILTAHHADDQAETVLMRLLRGSGLTGLAGMSRETQLAAGLALVRPLLAVSKQDLVALCRRDTIPFVEDPTNANTAYARARLRAEAATLSRLGLGRDKLMRLAVRMARADAALEAEARRVEASLVTWRPPGVCRLDLAGARELEAEILLRLLRRAVASVAAPQRVIRLERLERAAGAVSSALMAAAVHRGTLAGTHLALSKDGLLTITPEPARRRGRPAVEAVR